jgi:hypothetical protein
VNKSVENPTGSLTLKDEEFLGKHRHMGMLKYRDLDAGYCTACGTVYNITCPQCGIVARNMHDATDNLFFVQRPLETKREEGQLWTKCVCRKCDFAFKVVVH